MNGGPLSTLPVPSVETLRGRRWPATQTVVERVRAEAFRSQEWRPGCHRCGETATTEFDWAGATEWWRDHRDRCPG